MEHEKPGFQFSIQVAFCLHAVVSSDRCRSSTSEPLVSVSTKNILKSGSGVYMFPGFYPGFYQKPI